MPSINRRTFLRQSAIVTSGMATSGLVIIPSLASTESPVATTIYGQIRGYTDSGIYVFKGVRYGADTSRRRFMPPLAPEKWSGILDAVDYGASSPQAGERGGNMSEDCLFLNVFTPALRDKKKRPVLFYIHGGAYSGGSGSSPLYDGVRLCLIISINLVQRPLGLRHKKWLI